MKLTHRQISQIHSGHQTFFTTEANADAIYQDKLQKSFTTGEVVQKTFLVSATVKHRIRRNNKKVQPFIETMNETMFAIGEEIGAFKSEKGLDFYDKAKRAQLEKALSEAKKPAEKAKAQEALDKDISAAEELSKVFQKRWDPFLDSEEEAEEVDLRMVPLSGFEDDQELPSAFYEYYELLIED